MVSSIQIQDGPVHYILNILNFNCNISIMSVRKLTGTVSNSPLPSLTDTSLLYVVIFGCCNLQTFRNIIETKTIQYLTVQSQTMNKSSSNMYQKIIKKDGIDNRSFQLVRCLSFLSTVRTFFPQANTHNPYANGNFI